MTVENVDDKKRDENLLSIYHLIIQRHHLRISLMELNTLSVTYQFPEKVDDKTTDYSLTAETKEKISELIRHDLNQQIAALENSLEQKGICI